MEQRYEYPATIEPDGAGRFLVRFPDLPEALTDGASREAALDEAADCLSEAIAARLSDGIPLPLPSKVARDQQAVAPRPEIALKAALHKALAFRKATPADLARALGVDHKEARRLLDPASPSKLPRLAEALAALDYGISVGVFDKHSGKAPITAPFRARDGVAAG